ncbi:hypothetical protein N7481_009841 [Penicillium waksmanii]|uniref:uncharacterized protein n=1 Tax=Penicillium waksmanii TaxID=69791 RepID=UPI0025486E6C|nr:uncharacterized protein N7481_009841 [Penicillium waksmanii]KAJ5976134.1 hypothetical protein N7481_009841 [Penicillium waksmanii]
MAIKVPPGQSPPFETIDDKHHAGIIIITAAICLVISLVNLLICVYVRKFISPPWGSDDMILLGATITAVAESIVIFHSSSIGFGTDISLVAENVVNHIQMLTPRQRHKSFLWATLGLSTVGAIVSVLVISVDCEGNKPWAIPGASFRTYSHAGKRLPRLTSQPKFYFLLTVSLWSRVYRGIIHIISLIVFSSLRLSTLRGYTTTENPTLAAISHTVFTQLQLDYSLIACTVFCLRPFMSALTTHYGTAGDSNLASSSGGYSFGYGSRRQGNTDSYGSGRSRDYEMGRVMGRAGRRASGVIRDRPDVTDGRGNKTVVNEAARSVHSREGGSMHSGSDGSTRMIIRKDVEYSVSVEN